MNSMRASPNRNLLDPNFESYKLSHVATSVISATEFNEFDFKSLSRDNFSRLEIRLSSLHNALFQDPFRQGVSYYYTKNKQIKSLSIPSRKEDFQAGKLVFRVPDFEEKESRCNLSIKFLKLHVIIFNGLHGFYLLNTPSRLEDPNATWNVAFEAQLDLESSSAYLTDVMQSFTPDKKLQIDCLLVSVVDSTNSSKPQTCLDWFTFTEITGTWGISRHRRLVSHAFPEYTAFERNASFITICTAYPFTAVFDSQNSNIKLIDSVENLTSTVVDSSLRITWSQAGLNTPGNREDSSLVNILIHLGNQFKTNENGHIRAKDHFKVICSSCAPEGHNAFTLYRLIVQTRLSDEEGSLTKFEIFNARLFAPVRSSDTMWTYDSQTNCLDITVVKEQASVWLRLLADAEEEVRLNVHCDDSSVTEGDTGLGSDRPQPVFNVEQLEDVDMASESDCEDLFLQRVDSETLQTSVKSELLGHQWLYNAPLLCDANSDSCTVASQLLCARYDVDGLLWAPNPFSGNPWLHVATLQAFGYVLASKRNHRFVVSPPVRLVANRTTSQTDSPPITHLPFVAVADVSRHVYVYWQPNAPARDNEDNVGLQSPAAGDTELRYRGKSLGAGGSRSVHVAWQQVICLPEGSGEIIGFVALTSPFPACVVATATQLYLICLSQ